MAACGRARSQQHARFRVRHKHAPAPAMTADAFCGAGKDVAEYGVASVATGGVGGYSASRLGSGLSPLDDAVTSSGSQALHASPQSKCNAQCALLHALIAAGQTGARLHVGTCKRCGWH